MDATRHPLWNGSKIYHLAGGTLVNLVTQALTAYGLSHNWSAEQQQAAITFICVIAGLSAQVYGIVSAALMAYEDFLTTKQTIALARVAPQPIENPRPSGGV